MEIFLVFNSKTLSKFDLFVKSSIDKNNLVVNFEDENMFTILKSGSVSGIDGSVIDVEVDISKGMPAFSIVGLPDNAVKESKERVRTAIINSGHLFPQNRITINLAPAGIRKEGAGFDLPIATAIIASIYSMETDKIDDIFFFIRF